MPLVGATIRHTLDFVTESDGVAILQTKQRVVEKSYIPRSCAFVFLWSILLDARGRLPRALGDLLVQIKNFGFKIYAIRTSDIRDVVSAFPGGIHPFHDIFVQQEQQEFTTVFGRCYNQMREKNVIYFGSVDFMDCVISHRQEKDVFVAVDENPDEFDGTLSYLEELLAMVLVVQAGKRITSHLEIIH
jgi:hypothetical protein